LLSNQNLEHKLMMKWKWT